MDKKKVIAAFAQVLQHNGYSTNGHLSNHAVAEYLYKQLEVLTWLNGQLPEHKICAGTLNFEEIPVVTAPMPEDEGVNDFVDKIYALYPSKCPKRNTSLGKSYKDKDRIKRLLKIYTREQVEQVVQHEVKTNFGVNFMKNFSTFLNNFPDPQEIKPAEATTTIGTQKSEVVVINGITYK